MRVTGRKNNITRKVIRKEKKHENKENEKTAQYTDVYRNAG